MTSLVIPWLLAAGAQRMHTDSMHSHSVIQNFSLLFPSMSRQYQRTRKISLASPIRHIYFNDHRGTPTRARKRH